MTPAQKALWYIESHLGQDISLDEIAGIGGVSRFHLVRAFAAATGFPVMRYVRARRLSEAAKALSGGAPDILTVALDADYGSHEAFTRAFRDHFGRTPEMVRANGGLAQLDLTEPLIMDQTSLPALDAPRFETGRPLLLAGFSERYTMESSAGIPGLWQRFAPHIGHVPGEIASVAYGACYNVDDANNFDYLAGVEVTGFSNLPAEFSRLAVPEQRYAIFTHRGHIAGIRQTMSTIWNVWLPKSGYRAADGPLLERYGPEFDGRTGNGGFEIWLPVAQ